MKTDRPDQMRRVPPPRRHRLDDGDAPAALDDPEPFSISWHSNRGEPNSQYEAVELGCLKRDGLPAEFGGCQDS
jgi:hypothetical protein